MQLRPYQKQALHWLLNKEKNQSDRDNVSMHPLWEEYLWPLIDQDGQTVPYVPGLEKFYVNPYSGELSLDFPKQEQNCLGGILADGMLRSLDTHCQKLCTNMIYRNGSRKNK
jgi:DNA repair protein RAD5